MDRKQFVLWFMTAGIMLTVAAVNQAAPLGTAFTYNGRLTDAGNPAHGTYDFKFSLYDALTDGRQVEDTLTIPGVDVHDGYFQVKLDFGNTYQGIALWLEIEVAPSRSGTYTPLSPRQELTPTPYAIHASTAGAVAGGIGINGYGTEHYLAKFTDTKLIGTSQIFDTGDNIGIGTTNPDSFFDVNLAHGYVKIGRTQGEIFHAHFNGGGEGAGVEATLGDGSTKAFLAYDSPAGMFAGYFMGDVFLGGQVGIGVADPDGLLHIDTTYGYAKFGSPQERTFHAHYDALGTGAAVEASLGDGTTKALLAYDYQLGTFAGHFQGKVFFSGEVGIGVTDPDGPLHINLAHGYVKFGPAQEKMLQVHFDGSGPGAGMEVTLGDGTTKAFLGYEDSMRSFAGYFEGDVYLGDNVGIGVTEPDSPLHINLEHGYAKFGHSEGKIFRAYFDSVGSGAGIEATLGDETTKALLAYESPAGTFAGYFQGNVFISEKMGIGTASPQSKLHVNGGAWNLATTEGDLKIGDSIYRLKIGVATSGVGAGDVYVRAQGGTNRLVLGSDDHDVVHIQNETVKIGTSGTPFTDIRQLTGYITHDNGVPNFLWTDITLPAGWDMENTRVLSVEIKVNTQVYGIYWSGLGEGLHADHCGYNLHSNNILRIITPDYDSYRDRPYRVIIMRIP
jgi:hypothetical protein